MTYEHADRREGQRKKIDVTIRFYHANKPNQTHVAALLFDISESGISFFTQKKLEIADLLWIEINLPEQKLLLQIKHSIVQRGTDYLARVVRMKTIEPDAKYFISCCFLANTTSNDELKIY